MARRAEQASRRAAKEHEVAFALELELRPGLPLQDSRKLERRLEDYAEAQGLQFEGTQLRHLVSAPDRPVSVDDQVALIDWLIDQPGLIAVRLGPISGRAEAGVDGEGQGEGQDEGQGGDTAFLQIRSGDIALIGLTLLYRCGRITAALYLQILGGYVRPARCH